MFLVVFVTLVISIIGLYAQILSVESTRIYNSQKGLMDTMLAWHASAVSKARPLIQSNSLAIYPSSPCQLTKVGGPNGINTIPYTNCTSAADGSTVIMTSADLPPNYSMSNYSFYSIIFQNPAPAIDYVVTYAFYTDVNGNLQLPDSSGFTTGYTFSSLMNQFANKAPYNVTYGFVTASGTLSVASKSIGLVNQPSLPYAVPSVIPTNALAVISVAD